MTIMPDTSKASLARSVFRCIIDGQERPIGLLTGSHGSDLRGVSLGVALIVGV